MALKIRLDGSHTPGRTMTLAGIAADESVWTELEPQWEKEVLASGVAYLHMREAMALQGAFRGWSPDRRDGLLYRLLDMLRRFETNPRLHAFTCSVDLVAYERWTTTRKHPEPARLCARIVFGRILEWYGSFPEPILSTIDVVFDRGEPFMRHIQEDWLHKRTRKRYPVLGLVSGFAVRDMRQLPALQLADMISWARNRIQAQRSGDDYPDLARRIVNAIHGLHTDVGEEALAKSYFREEGVRAEQPRSRRLE